MYRVCVWCIVPLLRILLPESQVDLINTAMFSTAIFLTLLSFATATTATLCNIDPPQQCSWYNSNNTDEQRITLLINNLTTIEKINLLNSKSPAIPRLHIPYYAWWSEAAHGVAWAGTATVFPCSMALGATFDPLLVEAAGLAISNEARAKHLHHLNKTTHASELFFGLDFFAPNINIVRDIRWGRAQETYSEDPLLVGTLGAAVIKGMQQYDTKRQRYKTIATAKHFASYNVESNFAVGGTNGQYRLMYDVNVSHADLMQTFFPAFEDAIVHGGAGSIMCSYNRLNSYPMCASPYLKSIVRDRFKFPSYIVSDSGAVVSDFFVFLLYSRICFTYYSCLPYFILPHLYYAHLRALTQPTIIATQHLRASW